MTRHLARLASALAALGLAAGTASAQTPWPTKPITVIVPFAAGGNTDVMARILADSRIGELFLGGAMKG